MSTITIWPGHPYPLGATWDGYGVNFALFSENAEAVELCLFDRNGQETRVKLVERTDQIWHGYLPEIRPGQHYGYRVYGPYEPEKATASTPTSYCLTLTPNVLLTVAKSNGAILILLIKWVKMI